MVSGGTHHVVPLKDLMQDDPIEEAAQADTEDARHGDTGHCGAPPVARGDLIVVAIARSSPGTKGRKGLGRSSGTRLL